MMGIILFYVGGCQLPTDTVLDLALIVDSSGSICDNDATRITDQNGNPISCNNWGFVLSFLRLLLNELEIGEDENHIALIRFSSATTLIYGLNRFVLYVMCVTTTTAAAAAAAAAATAAANDSFSCISYCMQFVFDIYAKLSFKRSLFIVY